MHQRIPKAIASTRGYALRLSAFDWCVIRDGRILLWIPERPFRFRPKGSYVEIATSEDAKAYIRVTYDDSEKASEAWRCYLHALEYLK